MEMVNRRNILRAGIVGAGVVGGAVVAAETAQAAPAVTDDGWISVLDHGAVGDGTTDDTAAIQAAFDAAVATQPAHSILFPPGRTYRVKDQVVADGLTDAAIRGEGATVALTGASVVDRGKGVVRLNNCHRVRVTGLSIIDTDRTQQICGLYLSKSSHTLVDGVTVRNVLFTGITVWDGVGSQPAPGTSTDITITNCIVTGTRNGISTNGFDVRIVGNHVAMYWPSTAEAAATRGVWHDTSNYWDGIMVSKGADRTTVTGNTVTEVGQTGIFVEACTNLVVSGNTIIGNQLHGIEVDGTGGTGSGAAITGNSVTDCNGNINVVRFHDVSIVGNRVANTSASNASTCIAINTGASRVTVVGNHVNQAHLTFPAVWAEDGSKQGTVAATEVTVAANEVVAGVPYSLPAAVAVLQRSAAGQFTVNGQLIVTKGLGVGNSAVATTPGAVVRKIEVFSSTGVSLGFIPVYKTIS
jgi:hypothetical protein